MEFRDTHMTGTTTKRPGRNYHESFNTLDLACLVRLEGQGGGAKSPWRHLPGWPSIRTGHDWACAKMGPDHATVTTVCLGACEPPPRSSLFESDCKQFWVYLLGQIAGENYAFL